MVGEVEIQAVRPMRQVRQRFVPEHRQTRGQDFVSTLDDRRFADPRLRNVDDELRQPAGGRPSMGRGSTTDWVPQAKTYPAMS